MSGDGARHRKRHRDGLADLSVDRPPQCVPALRSLLLHARTQSGGWYSHTLGVADFPPNPHLLTRDTASAENSDEQDLLGVCQASGPGLSAEEGHVAPYFAGAALVRQVLKD